MLEFAISCRSQPNNSVSGAKAE